METKYLIRALVIGFIIAGGGIGLFLFMYLVVLTGQEPLLRLLGAFFTPIIAMAILIGGLLWLRNQD
jgi:heme/copper-type cytochrome/quinol oxidase subunit 4